MSDRIQGLDELGDLARGFLEPIKDIGDAVEDVVGPIKSLAAVYRLRKKLQFKSFLKGYYSNLSLKDSDKDALKKRLQDHLKDQNNIAILSDTLESALASRSLKATSILGYIASKQIADPKKIDFLDETLVSGLPRLTDFDLEVAIILVTREHYYRSSEEEEPYSTEYRIRDIVKENPELEITFGNPRMTMSIEKLKREQILDYGVGGVGSVGNSRGAFVLSAVLDRLLKYSRTIN